MPRKRNIGELEHVENQVRHQAKVAFRRAVDAALSVPWVAPEGSLASTPEARRAQRIVALGFLAAELHKLELAISGRF